MRIACPTCATAYEVPDDLLAAGTRLLRCARCSTAFPAVSPVTSDPLDAPAPSAPAPSAPLPPPEPQPSGEFATPDTQALPDPAPPIPDPPPAPPPPSAELAVPPLDRPKPTRGPADPFLPIDPPQAPPQPGQGALAAAWIASFGAIGAGLFALLHWQAEIAAAWPPAARFYAALGLS